MRKAGLTALATVVVAGTSLGSSCIGAASPDAPTCADVGGVFVAHGIDGRGDCMSADPRPKCHVPPDQQYAFNPTGNYIAELTMTPPFPGGTLGWYDLSLIKGASNSDCWKLPS